MSGTEALLVIGVISSIIAIVDGINQVYDAASDAQGIPEAFREVAGRLPIVTNILKSAKASISNGAVDEDSLKTNGVKRVIEACEEKAHKLNEIFKKVVPADGASRTERYLSAIKQLGKGSQVETLMKGILEDVQLLASDHGMKTLTITQLEEVARAIKEVLVIPPSVPQQLFQTQEAACLAALFLTDPMEDRKDLIHIKGARVDGTCTWIKTNPIYHSWVDSQTQLLWISGGPGKGKTMLSIFLAEDLQQMAQWSQDKLFLQYFCDNKDERRNTAIAVIRGLIFQLLQLRTELFAHILPTFEIRKEALFATLSFQALWNIFETMIRNPVIKTCYCIIDGLDEIDKDSLEMLLNALKALFSMRPNRSSTCFLKMIVVGRELPKLIPETLSEFPRIRLDPDADEDINNDIDRFINVRVDELSMHGNYPQPLNLYVKQVFRNRAMGMFLWVSLAVKMLRKYKATEIEKALDLFPPGLDELYDRMILQIDDARREVVAKILLWVVMAVRPLTLLELSAAIEPSDNHPTVAFTQQERMKDQVLYCGYFIAVTEYYDNPATYQDRNEYEEVYDRQPFETVSLIHQSAKDYLLRKTRNSNPTLEFFRISEEIGHSNIARRCLDYLEASVLLAFPYTESDQIYYQRSSWYRKHSSGLEAFPLLVYATRHWFEHARLLSKSDSIFNIARPFYSEAPICETWLKIYSIMTYDDFYSTQPKRGLLLHLASHFGILPLAENILHKRGLRTNLKRMYALKRVDKRGRAALHVAAMNGHIEIVQVLLKMGAKTQAKDLGGSTVLMDAVVGGHESVVRLLLGEGVKINTKNSDGETALIQAVSSYSDKTDIIRLFLEKGANIEAKDSNGETALIRAVSSYSDKTDIIRLFLEKGANIEAKDSNGETALIRAVLSYSDKTDIIRLFLEKGANIEAKDSNGKTALIRAVLSYSDKTDIIQLLLEKGANIEAKDSYGETALIYAVDRGNVNISRLLLEKGANIEAKDSNGETALMKAAHKKRMDVVQLLLEKGANVESKDIKGRTT